MKPLAWSCPLYSLIHQAFTAFPLPVSVVFPFCRPDFWVCRFFSMGLFPTRQPSDVSFALLCQFCCLLSVLAAVSSCPLCKHPQVRATPHLHCAALHCTVYWITSADIMCLISIARLSHFEDIRATDERRCSFQLFFVNLRQHLSSFVAFSPLQVHSVHWL